MSTNALQTLTSRNGRKTRAVVTYHAPIHGEARTVCGMTFESLRAQDLQRHQTSVCGEWSDVNCPGCKVSKAARYIFQHYSLVQTDGGWRAISFSSDGSMRSSFTGTLDEVQRKASANWGHFNFTEETLAFRRIFFGARS